MKTREKILIKALEMFNQRGIEYVGLREIAKTLGIRVSNITYYFPTKDDLVNQLWIQLKEDNNKLVVPNENITMYSFLEMFEKVFKNHILYQCIMLSFVHLMKRNKLIAVQYKNNVNHRNQALNSNIQALIDKGFLHDLDSDVKESFVSNLAIIIRFWISDLVVTLPQNSTGIYFFNYLINIARFFMPYTTELGKDEIEKFIIKYS